MSLVNRPRYASPRVSVEPLGKPLQLPYAKRAAPNRFLKAAMSETLCSWDANHPPKRGVPSKEIATLYRHWAEGGWGQIVTGNIIIDNVHLEAMGNATIPKDAPFEGTRFEGFQAMAEAGKSGGGLMVGQVSHGGRQVDARIQPEPVSASAIQLVAPSMGTTYGVPRAATDQDIKEIIEGFAHAAEYLEKAGFDGIQLHAAHGYLLAQFLSKTTNKRTDRYGGSLENRMRLLLEVAAEVKKRVSRAFVVGVKINSVEFQAEGFQPDEATALCEALENAEFDYVELSGGTYEKFGFQHFKESTRKRENFFIEFAEQIVKPLATLKVYTTGGFKTVGGMVDAMKTVDGVGLAKAAGQEPKLPNDLLAGRFTGTIRPSWDESNSNIGLLLTGVQLKRISQNSEPLDSSDPKQIESILSDTQIYLK